MIDNIIETIRQELQERVSNVGYSNIDVELSLEKKTHASRRQKIDKGDLSTPVALQIGGRYGKDPDEVAVEISNGIEKTDYVDDVNVVNGYVNINLDWNKIALDILDEVRDKSEEYGHLDKYDGREITIEHTSINPTGPINIGRARNPFIGDTLVRLYKAAGWKVYTHYYVNDMGKQVAIISWGLDNNVIEKFNVRFDENDEVVVTPRGDIFGGDTEEVNELMERHDNYKDKNEFDLFFTYVIANDYLTKESGHMKSVDLLLEKVEEGDRESIEKLREIAEYGLEGQKETLKRFNIEFDSFDHESDFVLDDSVGEIMERLKSLPQSYELDDGAWAIDLSEFGIEKQAIYDEEGEKLLEEGKRGEADKHIKGYVGTIFQRSNGTSIYSMRDVAYHIWKLGIADHCITLLGEDHKVEAKEVRYMLKLIDELPENKEVKAIHLSFVVMKEGQKMSTRRGITVPLDDLLDEGTDIVLNRTDKRDVAEKIAKGALRYNMLKVQPMKVIHFDWDEALDFEGDSSPYIQYAHARACGILDKIDFDEGDIGDIKITDDKEKEVLKQVIEFPDVVMDACETDAPHKMTAYVFELAKKFTRLYHDEKIIDMEDEIKKNTRFALVDACRQTLANGLHLLGIDALEEM